MLAYTNTDVEVPFTWTESDPKLIANPQMVKLHSFDTKVQFGLNQFCYLSTDMVYPLAISNTYFGYADSQG